MFYTICSIVIITLFIIIMNKAKEIDDALNETRKEE